MLIDERDMGKQNNSKTRKILGNVPVSSGIDQTTMLHEGAIALNAVLVIFKSNKDKLRKQAVTAVRCVS